MLYIEYMLRNAVHASVENEKLGSNENAVITCCHSIKFHFESLKAIFLELNSEEKGRFLYSSDASNQHHNFFCLHNTVQSRVTMLFPRSKCSYTNQPTEYQQGMP